MNIKVLYAKSNLLFIFAKDDIPKGSELFMDYCYGTNHSDRRNRLLSKYGISESLEKENDAEGRGVTALNDE